MRVDGANQVTINGFTAKHYNGNGFYVVNVSGYELNHLNATLVRRLRDLRLQLASAA